MLKGPSGSRSSQGARVSGSGPGSWLGPDKAPTRAPSPQRSETRDFGGEQMGESVSPPPLACPITCIASVRPRRGQNGVGWRFAAARPSHVGVGLSVGVLFRAPAAVEYIELHVDIWLEADESSEV